MCVVTSVDKFGDMGIFCPPQMHGGKHGDNVKTLDPTTVRGEQVKDIPQGNAGVKGVWFSEAPDPSVLDDLEDEGPAPHLIGLYEQLGGKSGSTF